MVACINPRLPVNLSHKWIAARWWLYARAVGLRRAKVRNSGAWIMGRISCLGLDVRKLLQWPLPLINTQKGRIDCLLAD
jgi:hypothetical protein